MEFSEDDDDLLGRALRRQEDDDDPELDFVAETDGRVHRSGERHRRTERVKLTELKALLSSVQSGQASTRTLTDWLQNVSRALQECARQAHIYSAQNAQYRDYWLVTLEGYQRAVAALDLVLEGVTQANADTTRHGLAAFESAVVDLELLATD